MRHLLLLTTLLIYTSEAWTQGINSEESITEFSVSNLGFRTVDGTISGLRGTISFDANNLTSSIIDVTLDVTTLDTNNEKRDNHLKNADFFEVEKYPTMGFISEKIEKTGPATYITTGRLTIKDITQTVKIPFRYNITNGVRSIAGGLTIDRKSFNVGEEYGKFMVGHDIEIRIKATLKSL